jgi:hypothetical protein
VTDAELIKELAALLANSKTRYTDPGLRADWSVRKQKALRLAQATTERENA